LHGAGLKFQILQEFLMLGYAVLLSDVDIVTIQNPFDHLVRDVDVEGMSDGWDDAKAYGYNDVFDDPAMHWSRYSHSMRVSVINRFAAVSYTCFSLHVAKIVGVSLTQMQATSAFARYLPQHGPTSCLSR
jgi:hypothetical protein